jgi:hypothetical protein
MWGPSAAQHVTDFTSAWIFLAAGRAALLRPACSRAGGVKKASQKPSVLEQTRAFALRIPKKVPAKIPGYLGF